ncbi:MAG: hypothetical protein JWR19_222 [Pedosphaera sp.]|nr:hypothetical protein [Pedosphaera sp.]
MEILDILKRASLQSDKRFLVIGGYAVNAHGYSRQTVDLDIMIEKSQADFWKKLLLDQGYSIFGERDAFVQFTAPKPEQPPIDFMLVNEQTFAGMHAEAVEGSLGGITVKHPSLRHLIALKLHVLKQELPHRHIRDLYDVMELLRINKVDTTSQDFKQFCEKYGNSTLYESLVRTTK